MPTSSGSSSTSGVCVCPPPEGEVVCGPLRLCLGEQRARCVCVSGPSASGRQVPLPQPSCRLAGAHGEPCWGHRDLASGASLGSCSHWSCWLQARPAVEADPTPCCRAPGSAATDQASEPLILVLRNFLSCLVWGLRLAQDLQLFVGSASLVSRGGVGVLPPRRQCCR